MVWFYGGSFEEGWSDRPDYDGGNLASRGDVIVVTVNYRVGVLGFLTTGSMLRGNQGLQDQILALQWIQQHMSDYSSRTEVVITSLTYLNSMAFGGDPSRVMIFGQSAGAQSVVAHISSSASKGLFSSAISQSSLLGVSFVTRDINSKYITPALANVTNCTTLTEADMITCLRAVPAEQFVQTNVIHVIEHTAAVVFNQFDGINAGLATAEPYLPITAASGGPPGIIDDQFQYLLGNGSIPNRVPFMVGTMRNEAGLFIPMAPAFVNEVPTSQAEYVGILESGQVVPKDTAEAILSSGLVRFAHPPLIMVSNGSCIVSAEYVQS